MNQSRNILVCMLLAVLLMAGCKGGKDASTSHNQDRERSTQKALYNQMVAAYGSWDTFVARGSMSMGYLSSSFELRMIRDKALQLSLRPVLGIEIARAIITQDSLMIYDKLHKQQVIASLSELGNFSPITPTLSVIQSILLGRPFLTEQETINQETFDCFNIAIGDEHWLMTPLQQPQELTYAFDMKGTQCSMLQCSQKLANRHFSCLYNHYDTSLCCIVPTQLTFSLKGESNSYAAEIDYTSCSFNTTTTITPVKSGGYTTTTIIDFLKSLTK